MASNSTPDGFQSQTRLWKLSALGFTMACEIVAGMALGWLVDTWTGTEKVFLITGTIIGIIVGMTGFIRTAMKENKATQVRIQSDQRDQEPKS
jgi:F0F1-type ATP synthase assembly protein I